MIATSDWILFVTTAPAAAQDTSVNFGQGKRLTERVIQMIALMTVLSLTPSILVMMTSFTRIRAYAGIVTIIVPSAADNRSRIRTA